MHVIYSNIIKASIYRNAINRKILKSIIFQFSLILIVSLSFVKYRISINFLQNPEKP